MALPTSAFEYDLPPELIAQRPSARRGESRLLVVQRRDGGLAHRSFADLLELVPPGDLLVLNATRVRHARLLGRRPSGAPAEVLLLQPVGPDRWIALGRPGSALLPGKRVQLAEGLVVETLEVLEDGSRLVRLLGGSAEEIMARVGRLPLPPYIERDPTPEDEERYQTVFAEREGSVAAPTAGLHFTLELLQELTRRGVQVARLELQVGPGTFRPVETEDPSRHPMHAERYFIPEALPELVRQTRAQGGAIWAVGTTVVRALEAATGEDAALLAGPGETRLLITPGYRFRAVDRLITNFHLPRSTLLMLVAAFAGYETTRAAYAEAIRQGYRFYSYGDAMAVVP
ncbi:MAG TPA: tRNA preQ1(34) S-adenosylmethionine ribosyltransferase-isomerase QueA [Gemmatimonadales bacterium]|nr:tRNA preQ1(34) S-adenosylmethionine ribosyltransferase-isomerase QueA [Gemmatimonadales bacterium]